MNLPFYIARRYFIAKKSANVINIISIISMMGIGVGTLALVVVLSAFNGLEDFIESIYSPFDPDIRIIPAEGKTFDRNTLAIDSISQVEGVEYCSRIIEETVLMTYGESQGFARVKGVEEDFIGIAELDNLLREGTLLLKSDPDTNQVTPAAGMSQPVLQGVEGGYQQVTRGDTLLIDPGPPEPTYYAILGVYIANSLEIYLGMVNDDLKMFAARRGRRGSTNQLNDFRERNVIPIGVFESVNPDFDAEYVIVDIDFAADLLDYKEDISAVELGLAPGADLEEVRARVRAIAGDDFKVQTNYEFNELIYQTNETEKWVTYLILTFILVIATFNVIGSITMLILDKKEDIAILRSLGAGKRLMTRIFLFEGLMITFVGGALGLFLGVLLCWLQENYCLVTLKDSVIECYPVTVELGDLGTIALTVLVIGLISAWFPARFVSRRFYH